MRGKGGLGRYVRGGRGKGVRSGRAIESGMVGVVRKGKEKIEGMGMVGGMNSKGDGDEGTVPEGAS